jgi:hypothetical protein
MLGQYIIDGENISRDRSIDELEGITARLGIIIDASLPNAVQKN